METMALIQVRVPKTLAKRLKIHAVKHDKTMSDVVAHAIERELKENK